MISDGKCCSYFSKLVYRFSTIPATIPMNLFVEVEKRTSKPYRLARGPQVAETYLRERTSLKICLLILKIHCRTRVIKTVWHWHRQTYRLVEENPKSVNKLTQQITSNKGTSPFNGEIDLRNWC